MKKVILPPRTLTVREQKLATLVALLDKGFKLLAEKHDFAELEIPSNALIEGIEVGEVVNGKWIIEETRLEIYKSEEAVGGDDNNDWTVLVIKDEFTDLVFFAY